MQIGGVASALATIQMQTSGSNLPPEMTTTGKEMPEKSLVRELAESIDPKNMSRKESMAIANALMKAGEGDLSSAFLPPPLLKLNSDGSVTDLTGTPEGEARMNEKFNMFESLASQVEYRKSIGESTKRLEEAFSFVEKILVARNTPNIDEYT